jgi:hypothetical protein
VRLRCEPPGACPAKLVTELVEDRNRPLSNAEELAGVDLQLREEAQKSPLDERVGRQPPVAGGGRRFDRLRQRAIGPAQVACDPLHRADVRNEFHTQWVFRR